ncbi:MAG TPA: xanthine dehydrogenase family protein subunit M [Stellaceae bacterium]|nr:xanthine dehydrogenase family protein subunit M [Stellaceae bacterium]
MKLHLPESLDEAVALLQTYEEARCLAGGQTLVAMLNANLLFPDALIGLKRIKSLDGIERKADGAVAIGAMTPHRAIAESSQFGAAQAILGEAARGIAHPPIRNFGTIGGSIAHADPAADLPTALAAAAATVEIYGPKGARTVPVEDFFVSYLTTVLEPGEIVTCIHVPRGPDAARCAYYKLSRIAGDLAILSVAVVVAIQDGICTEARIALGGCGPTPIRLTAADRALVGEPISDRSIARASEALAAECRPFDDFRATARYRLRVMPRIVRRTILSAAGRA